MAELLSAASVRSIGWALVHFVWQGVLIGAATAAALNLLSRARSTARYAVSCAGLALMLAVPVAAVITDHDRTPSTDTPGLAASTADRVPAPTSATSRVHAGAASGPGRPLTLLEPYLPAMVFGWMAGVLMLSIRLAAGYVRVERLTRRGTRPVSDAVADRIGELSRRLGTSRTIRAFESAAVAVPAVVGGLKPVILLPASVLTGLPAAHLDAVIAHELAHIRRHDYVVNVLQTLVETLLFFHPAVWWCSRQVRIERELCCDDLVVDVCGDRLAYATALANLEELRHRPMMPALSAADGELVTRVRRLLSSAPVHAKGSSSWVAVSGVAFILALAVAVPMISSDVPPSLDEPQVSDAPALASPPVSPELPDSPDRATVGPMLKPWAFADYVAIWRDGGINPTWVNFYGRIELSPDDSDVIAIAPGGHVTFGEGGVLSRWFGTARRLTLVARADGTIARTYTVNRRERPYEPEGREWLREALPRVVRGTGFGAEARVARILAADGVNGLTRALRDLESDFLRRLYVTMAVQQSSLDADQIGQLLQSAEIGSDYELAEALIATALSGPLAEPAVPGFFAAVDRIGSDYERRRVLSVVAARPGVTLRVLEAVLQSSTRMGSDYERATLLLEVAERHAIGDALRDPYLAAASTIGSDYERGRAIEPAVGQLAATAAARVSAQARAESALRARADVAAQIEARARANAQRGAELRMRQHIEQLRVQLAAMEAQVQAAERRSAIDIERDMAAMRQVLDGLQERLEELYRVNEEFPAPDEPGR